MTTRHFTKDVCGHFICPYNHLCGFMPQSRFFDLKRHMENKHGIVAINDQPKIVSKSGYFKNKCNKIRHTKRKGIKWVKSGVGHYAIISMKWNDKDISNADKAVRNLITKLNPKKWSNINERNGVSDHCRHQINLTSEAKSKYYFFNC